MLMASLVYPFGMLSFVLQARVFLQHEVSVALQNLEADIVTFFDAPLSCLPCCAIGSPT
jgi:hypothetical protein